MLLLWCYQLLFISGLSEANSRPPWARSRDGWSLTHKLEQQTPSRLSRAADPSDQLADINRRQILDQLLASRKQRLVDEEGSEQQRRQPRQQPEEDDLVISFPGQPARPSTTSHRQNPSVPNRQVSPKSPNRPPPPRATPRPKLRPRPTEPPNNNLDEAVSTTTEFNKNHLSNIGKKGSPYQHLHEYRPPSTAGRPLPIPNNELNELDGVDPSEVFLKDGDLIILKGHGYSESYNQKLAKEPIDAYEAPYREPKLPPPGLEFGGPSGIYGDPFEGIDIECFESGDCFPTGFGFGNFDDDGGIVVGPHFGGVSFSDPRTYVPQFDPTQYDIVDVPVFPLQEQPAPPPRPQDPSKAPVSNIPSSLAGFEIVDIVLSEGTPPRDEGPPPPPKKPSKKPVVSSLGSFNPFPGFEVVGIGTPMTDKASVAQVPQRPGPTPSKPSSSSRPTPGDTQILFPDDPILGGPKPVRRLPVFPRRRRPTSKDPFINYLNRPHTIYRPRPRQPTPYIHFPGDLNAADVSTFSDYFSDGKFGNRIEPSGPYEQEQPTTRAPPSTTSRPKLQDLFFRSSPRPILSSSAVPLFDGFNDLEAQEEDFGFSSPPLQHRQGEALFSRTPLTSRTPRPLAAPNARFRHSELDLPPRRARRPHRLPTRDFRQELTSVGIDRNYSILSPTPSPVQYHSSPYPIQYQTTPSPIQFQTTPSPIQYQTTPSPIQYQTTPSPIQYQTTPSPIQYQHSPSFPYFPSSTPASRAPPFQYSTTASTPFSEFGDLYDELNNEFGHRLQAQQQAQAALPTGPTANGREPLDEDYYQNRKKASASKYGGEPGRGRGQSGHSLHKDTDVNFLPPLPTVNPHAESILGQITNGHNSRFYDAFGLRYHSSFRPQASFSSTGSGFGRPVIFNRQGSALSHYRQGGETATAGKGSPTSSAKRHYSADDTLRRTGGVPNPTGHVSYRFQMGPSRAPLVEYRYRVQPSS